MVVIEYSRSVPERVSSVSGLSAMQHDFSFHTADDLSFRGGATRPSLSVGQHQMLGEVATSHIQRTDVGTSTGTTLLRQTLQGRANQSANTDSIISAIRGTETSTQSPPLCPPKTFVDSRKTRASIVEPSIAQHTRTYSLSHLQENPILGTAQATPRHGRT